MTKNLSEKFELITRNTEEVLKEEEVIPLLENTDKVKHYIGFEISGKIHLGTGIMCMSKVKDFMEAGVECSIFLADWHSWINDKLGGDRELIKKVAVEYFKEGLKASLKAVGGNPEKVKFVLGSELYHNADDYWATVIEISKHTPLRRILRSITILGRNEGETVDFAKLIYPPMQVADIFYQGVNLTHAGLDQRKAHVIAREVGEKLKICPLLDKDGKPIKPVVVHHHLLLGLQKPPIWPVPEENLQSLWSSMKMSKSIPNSAIFITEEPSVIRKKLNKAFCPEREIYFNPVLDWTKHVIFRDEKSILEIKRPQKYGGDVVYENYYDLANDFEDGKLHPLDLKKAVAEKIIEILKPIREHFSNPKLKKMKEQMEELSITR
ncbi:MAG: tyrosine--tRNA ligase [Promethearchaeota archaeon]